jgi:hypothetical protein
MLLRECSCSTVMLMYNANAPCAPLNVIYNATTATIIALIAPITEPARWPAALAVAMAGEVEVAETVGFPVVLRVFVPFE